MDRIKFKGTITGVFDFDETCRIQVALQETLLRLGYDMDSTNFSLDFPIDLIKLEDREYTAEELLNLLPKFFDFGFNDLVIERCILNVHPAAECWIVEYYGKDHEYGLSTASKSLKDAALQMIDKFNDYISNPYNL